MAINVLILVEASWFNNNDHVDNIQLSKKIKPLPLHSTYILELYIWKDFTYHKYFRADLFNCPASGVDDNAIIDKLTIDCFQNPVMCLEEEMCKHMKSTHMCRILQDRENSYFFEK